MAAVNKHAQSFFTADSHSDYFTREQTDAKGNKRSVNYYKPGVIKNFYKISEFYNFIKTPANNPISTRNHVLVPYPHNGNQYFLNKTDDLYRMALSFQSISDMPDMSSIESKALDINNSLGRYSTMENITFGSGNNSFKAQFIQMNQPIHESFFYKWYFFYDKR